MVPCVIFEDEHLLVVNKPAGWNTHAPSPFAGEGIYDWLKHREPRWASLAIIHRLDKETSGVLVFGKTPLANKSLTEQFTAPPRPQKILLLTDRAVPAKEFTVEARSSGSAKNTPAVRAGKWRKQIHAGCRRQIRIQKLRSLKMVSAEPLTGRTHQIRVHAAENGFPILGDTLYGGTACRARLFARGGNRVHHPATERSQ